ncbi:hypothetical protein CYMTET_22499 [Cymbomonas tetramitiformis]|uniref:Uncharacterized protein n=1 Tax=Cymbomonas tetramitiformis TaxID=36881 RepID=A0AAE0L249_9CHLO|nr:hypothetical protein CYMTET_22499 [Cymbomonas tetramitiformis]
MLNNHNISVYEIPDVTSSLLWWADAGGALHCAASAAPVSLLLCEAADDNALFCIVITDISGSLLRRASVRGKPCSAAGLSSGGSASCWFITGVTLRWADDRSAPLRGVEVSGSSPRWTAAGRTLCCAAAPGLLLYRFTRRVVNRAAAGTVSSDTEVTAVTLVAGAGVDVVPEGRAARGWREGQRRYQRSVAAVVAVAGAVPAVDAGVTIVAAAEAIVAVATAEGTTVAARATATNVVADEDATDVGRTPAVVAAHEGATVVAVRATAVEYSAATAVAVADAEVVAAHITAAAVGATVVVM